VSRGGNKSPRTPQEIVEDEQSLSLSGEKFSQRLKTAGIKNKQA
jgi:hypothetical protein